MYRHVLLICAAGLLWSGALPAQTAASRTISYAEKQVNEVKTRIKEIRVDELTALRKAGRPVVLVDVREDHEWAKSRIPGAIHISRGVLEFSVEGKIPRKDAPIVAYCLGGGRSVLAAETLTRMGYTNVASLAGGIAAYEAAGLAVDKSAPAK